MHGSITGHHLSYFYTSRKLESVHLREWLNILDRFDLNCSALTSRPIPPVLSVADFAEYLADFYAIWSQLVLEDKSVAEVIRLPEGQVYEDWLQRGGEANQYWPVHRLKEILNSEYQDLFLKTLVHGSVGTLDDVAGFSDLDLAFIVKKEVLCNKGQLLKLRRFSVDSLCLTYAFDPYMHHGPYYLSEIDLSYYPESLFPSVLFQHGVALNPQKDEIFYRGYSANIFADDLFDGYLRHFRDYIDHNRYIDNSYDLELLLGSIAILPALFLQRITGVYRYKRDTFSEARVHFDEDAWQPIEIATDLRQELKPRWRPRKDQVETALRLKWPGLLQKLALECSDDPERFISVNQKLREGLLNDVVALCLSMKRAICQEASPQQIWSGGAAATLERAFFGHLTSTEYTDLPFTAIPENYDNAKQSLLDVWTTQDIKPISIYQIGSVNALGHSDLDFVVVWPNDQNIPHDKFHPTNFDLSMRKYLVHAPYFCTRELWQELYAWYPTFNLKHLWGEVLSMPRQMDEEIGPGLALSHLVDTLLIKMPEDLLFYSLQRPVRQRVVINTLYSLRYTVELARMAGLDVPSKHLDFMGKVKNLRVEWFQSVGDSTERLMILCSEALSIIGELQQLACAKIQNICKLEDKACAQTEWTMSSYRHTLDQYLRHYINCGRPLSIAPPKAFLAFLGCYSSLEPRVKSSLEKFGSVSDAFCSDQEYLPGIRYHVASMVKYAESMLPLGVPSSKYLSLGYSLKNENDVIQEKTYFAKGFRARIKSMFRLESALDRVDRFFLRWVLPKL